MKPAAGNVARRHRSRSGAAAKIVVATALLAAAAFVAVVAALPAPPKKFVPKRIPPVNVAVIPIRPIPEMLDLVRLPGTVDPNRVVRVSAEVPGRIEQIPCREGRPCTAGEKLVLLNTDLLQADYDQTRATMEFDAREVRRLAELVERGAATTNELDQARTKSSASRAALDAARARLDRAVISAPISGELNQVPVEVGEYVSPGQVVAEIVDVETVLIVVAVPERDVEYVKLGQTEAAFIDALGGKKVTGTVTYIGEVADPGSRTTRVELTVKNPDRSLASGQIVSVHLERQKLRDVIMIPLDAAISLEKGYRVYVAEDGLAQPRDIRIGMLKGGSVRVLEGLKAGDLLIVKGQYYVGPGQPVRIVGGNTATQPTTAPTGGPRRERSGEKGIAQIRKLHGLGAPSEDLLSAIPESHNPRNPLLFATSHDPRSAPIRNRPRVGERPEEARP